MANRVMRRYPLYEKEIVKMPRGGVVFSVGHLQNGIPFVNASVDPTEGDDNRFFYVMDDETPYNPEGMCFHGTITYIVGKSVKTKHVFERVHVPADDE